MGWLRSFPPDGVALQLWFGERIPAPPPLRDSSLPLRPSSFLLARRYVGGQDQNWSLPLHIATISQSGPVLFSPFFGGLLGLALKGNPWTPTPKNAG